MVAKFPANAGRQSAARTGLAVASGRALGAGQRACAGGVRGSTYGDPIRQWLGSAGRSSGTDGRCQSGGIKGSDGARRRIGHRPVGGRNPSFRIRLRGSERDARFHRLEPELDWFRHGREPGRRARLIGRTRTWKQQHETGAGQSPRHELAANAKMVNGAFHSGSRPD